MVIADWRIRLFGLGRPSTERKIFWSRIWPDSDDSLFSLRKRRSIWTSYYEVHTEMLEFRTIRATCQTAIDGVWSGDSSLTGLPLVVYRQCPLWHCSSDKFAKLACFSIGSICLKICSNSLSFVIRLGATGSVGDPQSRPIVKWPNSTAFQNLEAKVCILKFGFQCSNSKIRTFGIQSGFECLLIANWLNGIWLIKRATVWRFCRTSSHSFGRFCGADFVKSYRKC